MIVGGVSYGQGSSREHAAICPMYLGVKLVIVKSMERIHQANLINFGILPLFFADEADYDRLGEGVRLEFSGLRDQLRSGGGRITATLDGKAVEFTHPLTAAEVEVVLAGGKLNCIKD